MYNTKDGTWYDYNIINKQANTKFYPSNLAPLYTSCYHMDINMNTTIDYMMSSPAMNQSGGLPSSLQRTGQQWDMPNMWPPLVKFLYHTLYLLVIIYHTLYLPVILNYRLYLTIIIYHIF